MCLSPLLINKPLHLQNNSFQSIVSGNRSYAYVPCGVCPSCLALKQSYWIQRCQLETIDNDLWFCTLTYNNESLPVLNVNGRNIKYALVSDIQNFIKMLRKYNVFGSSFRYIAVSEFGSKQGSHRPHWHLIFSTPKRPNDKFCDILTRETQLRKDILHYWRRNYGSTRVPLWKPLLTYVQRGSKSNYDFHYVNPSLSTHGEDDVAFYVTKYIMKANDYVKRLKSALYFNLSDSEFKRVWQTVKPHFLVSKGFSDFKNDKVKNYVNKCIQTSLDDKHDYLVFVNPITGQEFPMSPYLREKFSSYDDQYFFYERNGCETLIPPETFSNTEYDLKLSLGNKRKRIVNSRDTISFVQDDDLLVNIKYESPTISVRLINNSDVDINTSFDDEHLLSLIDLPPDEDLPPSGFYDNFKKALHYGY